MIRHSRAVHLRKGGMPLPLLAEFLGHSQLETTQIYASADVSMKAKAIQKAIGGCGDDVDKLSEDLDVFKKLTGLK